MERSIRHRALNALLWYCLFAWGIWLGGTVYQMLVVVPMWSTSLPASLHSFLQGTDYNRLIYHFFGPPFIAARTVPTFIALGLAWNLPAHRLALGVAAACVVAIVIFTLGYIYPINAVLFDAAGGNHSPAEITAMARTWILADRIRLGVGVIAFIALLRAFRLPLQQR